MLNFLSMFVVFAAAQKGFLERTLLARSAREGLAEYYFYLALLTAAVTAILLFCIKLFLDKRARDSGDLGAVARGPKRSMILLLVGFLGFLAIWFLFMIGIENRWPWVMALTLAPRSSAPWRYLETVNIIKLAVLGGLLNAVFFVILLLPFHRHHLPWRG